jgi:hypothetical protein
LKQENTQLRKMCNQQNEMDQNAHNSSTNQIKELKIKNKTQEQDILSVNKFELLYF